MLHWAVCRRRCSPMMSSRIKRSSWVSSSLAQNLLANYAPPLLGLVPLMSANSATTVTGHDRKSALEDRAA